MLFCYFWWTVNACHKFQRPFLNCVLYFSTGISRYKEHIGTAQNWSLYREYFIIKVYGSETGIWILILITGWSLYQRSLYRELPVVLPSIYSQILFLSIFQTAFFCFSTFYIFPIFKHCVKSNTQTINYQV